MQKWVVSKNDLNLTSRQNGISAFIRTRNDGDYIEQVIKSHLPFLDEIVIVYNRCTDNTPEIVEKYQSLYPGKIKVFKYEPDVYPQGSKECQSLPPNSPHSLVNYYNYALCKTTRKIALKVDGDQIAIPSEYHKMVRFVKSMKKFPFYFTFRGINLWDKNGQIYVLQNGPLTVFDRGFFEVNNSTWHILDKVRALELFRGGNHAPKKHVTPAYFHVKSMKQDRGLGNYDLQDNPDSRYHGVIEKYYTSPKVWTWAEFKKYEPQARYVIDPESLGIEPILDRE
ncbi:MAG: glycosyltransferase [Phenylobacterium sp.]